MGLLTSLKERNCINECVYVMQAPNVLCDCLPEVRLMSTLSLFRGEERVSHWDDARCSSPVKTFRSSSGSRTVSAPVVSLSIARRLDPKKKTQSQIKYERSRLESKHRGNIGKSISGWTEII